MFKEKWHFILAGVLALVFVLKGFLEGRSHNGMIDEFRDDLQRRVTNKREEAINRAEEKYDDAVGSDLHDRLDDVLGPRKQ